MKIKNILLYIHQLPQNLIGLILILWNRKTLKKITDKKTKITYYTAKKVANSGISLGNYIILDSDTYILKNDIKHEHGHQLQSIRLGWLYLIIIGISSFCGNIFDRLFHKKWSRLERINWYYNQPWEKWADKLGGVNRFDD